MLRAWLFLAFLFFSSCSINRWSIKTCKDLSSNLVTADSCTVKDLQNMKLPWQFHRSEMENVIVTLRGRVYMKKQEEDGDIHLVIEDAGVKMVTELPNPKEMGCYQEEVTECKKVLRQIVVGDSVRIQGVLFRDYPHAKYHGNGVEVHPILHIQKIQDLP